MGTFEDHFVKKIVLHNRFSSPAEVEECLELQKQNPEKSLAELLLEKGYLKPEQWSLLQSLQKASLPERRKETEEENLFGKIVLMKQYAREGEVQECLKIQKELRQKGQYLKLGEILVQKAYLSRYQVEEILREQRQNQQGLPTLTCQVCGQSFEVSAEENCWRFYCRQCLFSLKLPR